MSDPERTAGPQVGEGVEAGQDGSRPCPIRGHGPWPWAAALLVAMSIAAAYVAVSFARGDVDRSFWPASAVEVLRSLAIAGVMLAAARRSRPSSRRLAHAWSFLAAAQLAYAAGDLMTAAGVELTGGTGSAVMNGFYVAFYPLFLAGVLRLPSAPLYRRDRARLFLDMAVVVLAAGIVLWNSVAWAQGVSGEPRPWTVALTSAFLLGDLALLVAVLSLLFTREVGPGRLVTRLLAAGAGLLIVADLAYAYQILGAHLWLAGWIGFGFTVSHLLAGLAAFAALRALQGGIRSSRRRRPRSGRPAPGRRSWSRPARWCWRGAPTPCARRRVPAPSGSRSRSPSSSSSPSASGTRSG